MNGSGRQTTRVGRARDVAVGNIYKHSTIVSGAGPTPRPELDRDATARHVLQQHEQVAQQFAPLFLRKNFQPLPALHVLPASMLWSQSGPRELPDGEVESHVGAVPLTTAAREHPFLVLRGDPGSGKTWSCQFLARQAARAWLEGAPHLPVLVELHGFRAREDEPPEDSLARLVALALRQQGGLRAGYEPEAAHGRDWLAEAIDGAPMLLLLDGLNEVAPASRLAAHDAIRDLIERWQGSASRIVVTTRRYGFEALRLGPARIYDINPLDEASIIDFLQRRLDWTPERVRTIYREELGARLRVQSANPLFLSLLCEVLHQGGRVPRSRGELYRGFVDGVLSDWEQGEKLVDFGQRAFSLAVKYRALGPLAAQMQRAGRALAEADVVAVFRRGAGLTEEAARALIEELGTNHLLQRRSAGFAAAEGGEGAVTFTHHTLQEYFCAGELVRTWQEGAWPGGPPALEELPGAPEWWEPAAMAGGLLDDVALGRLFQRIPDEPVLLGLILGSARPGTRAEDWFVADAERKAGRGIVYGVVVSQGLLFLAFGLGAGALLAQMMLPVARPLSIALQGVGVDPLQGAPNPLVLAFGMGYLVLFVATPGWFASWIEPGQARLVEGVFRDRVEPWLRGLHYANHASARAALERLRRGHQGRRFVSAHVQAQLEAFATEPLRRRREELVEGLESKGLQPLALSLLGWEYDPDIARSLLDDLARDRLGAGGLQLLLEWCRRSAQARRAVLPALEAQVLDPRRSPVARVRLGRALVGARLSESGPGWRVWVLAARDGLASALRKVFSGFADALCVPTFVLVLLLLLVYKPLGAVWAGGAGRVLDLIGLIGASPFLRAWVSTLSNDLGRAGRSGAAVTIARRGVALRPHHAGSHQSLVDRLVEAGSYEEAEEVLAGALARFRGNPSVHWSEGNLHSIRGRHAEAAEAYRRALVARPGYPPLLRNRAQSLMEAGDLEESEATARLALERDGDDARSHVVLADTLIAFRRFAEADRLLDMASKRFPTHAALRGARRDLLRSTGRYDACLAAYDEDPEALRGEPRIRAWRAETLRLAGRLRDADEQLAVLEAQRAEVALTRCIRGRIHGDRGDFDAAERCFEVGVDAPLVTNGRLDLAGIFLATARPALALAPLEAAKVDARAAADRHQARLLLAEAHLRLGAPGRAVTELDALPLHARTSWAHLLRGLADGRFVADDPLAARAQRYLQGAGHDQPPPAVYLDRLERHAACVFDAALVTPRFTSRTDAERVRGLLEAVVRS